jgi:hypothetical protein
MKTYHGTDSKNLYSILKQGFDLKKSGINFGSTFGNGIYTTPNIPYASTYITNNNSELYQLIICEVDCLSSIIINKPLKKSKYNKIKEDVIIIDYNSEILCKNKTKIKVIGILQIKKIMDNNTLIKVEIIEERLLGDKWTEFNILI